MLSVDGRSTSWRHISQKACAAPQSDYNLWKDTTPSKTTNSALHCPPYEIRNKPLKAYIIQNIASNRKRIKDIKATTHKCILSEDPIATRLHNEDNSITHRIVMSLNPWNEYSSRVHCGIWIRTLITTWYQFCSFCRVLLSFISCFVCFVCKSGWGIIRWYSSSPLRIFRDAFYDYVILNVYCRMRWREKKLIQCIALKGGLHRELWIRLGP